MVRVIWHGHACFELQGKQVTIVTDPFEGIGIPEPKAAADIYSAPTAIKTITTSNPSWEKKDRRLKAL